MSGGISSGLISSFLDTIRINASFAQFVGKGRGRGAAPEGRAKPEGRSPQSRPSDARAMPTKIKARMSAPEFALVTQGEWRATIGPLVRGVERF